MPINDYLIRKAQTFDTDSLVMCIDAAYAEYVKTLPDMPSVSEGCAEEIAQNRVWVAVEENKIIGCLFLKPEEGFMKLANLAVHPDHGGKGMGRSLIALAEKEAKRQGYDEMRLNTHTAIPGNIRLYIHLGWHEYGRAGKTVQMKKIL